MFKSKLNIKKNKYTLEHITKSYLDEATDIDDLYDSIENELNNDKVKVISFFANSLKTLLFSLLSYFEYKFNQVGGLDKISFASFKNQIG